MKDISHDSSNPGTPELKSRSLKLILVFLSLLLCSGGYMWTSFNLEAVDRRLKVTYEIEGPDVEITNVNWNSQWAGALPGVAVGFEVVNLGNQDLEIVSIGITLRDALGNELAHPPARFEDFYWGDIPQGHVLLRGGTRPESAIVSLNPLLLPVPVPLLWTEAIIKLEIRPISPESLALYWRSDKITVQSAAYVRTRRYVLEGHVADFDAFASQYRTEGRVGLNVQAIVSLYNSDGRIIGSFGVPVPEGASGDFTLYLDDIPDRGADRIETYKVWFAELRPR